MSERSRSRRPAGPAGRRSCMAAWAFGHANDRTSRLTLTPQTTFGLQVWSWGRCHARPRGTFATTVRHERRQRVVRLGAVPWATATALRLVPSAQPAGESRGRRADEECAGGRSSRLEPRGSRSRHAARCATLRRSGAQAGTEARSQPPSFCCPKVGAEGGSPGAAKNDGSDKWQPAHSRERS